MNYCIHLTNENVTSFYQINHNLVDAELVYSQNDVLLKIHCQKNLLYFSTYILKGFLDLVDQLRFPKSRKYLAKVHLDHWVKEHQLLNSLCPMQKQLPFLQGPPLEQVHLAILYSALFQTIEVNFS